MNTLSKNAFKWFNTAVVVFFMFFFGAVISPFSTVTEVGVRVLGVFLGLVYGWSTIGMLWPSLMGMAALSFTGLFSMEQISQQGFGNSTVLFILLIMIIIENMNQSGFITNIAYWLVSRPFCKGHPWTLIAVMFLTAYILAAFSNAFAVIFLCWNFWYSILNRSGYQPYEKLTTAVITGTILSCVMGSLILPFRQLPMVLLNAFSKAVGESVNYAAYMGVMIPFTLLCLAEFLLLLRFVIRPDVQPLESFDPLTLAENDQITFTRYQLATALGLIALIICLTIPGFFPASWPLVIFLKKLGTAGSALLVIAVMCWFKIDGKPIMDLGRAAKNGVNWDVIFFFTMVLFISTCLTNEATGLSPFLTSVIKPLVLSQGAFGFVILLLLAAAIITNFFNNTVTAMLFMQLIIAFSGTLQTAGINAWAVMALLIVAANLAFWTPVACTTAGLLYSNTAWIKKADVFKIVFPTSLLWIITLFVIAYPLANFIYS